MKKLLKHEWKFYGSITFLLTVILIGWQWGSSGGEYYPWGMYEFEIEDLFYFVPDMLMSMYYIEVGNIVITVAAYYLLKLYQYWTERNSYGRDFLAALPVRKKEAACFYLFADALFILVPNILFILVKYVRIKTMLANSHVTIPWLFDAVPSMILTIAAYLLMLLAVSRFIEFLIVNGVWKIFGSVAVGVMCMISLLGLEVGEDFIFIDQRENVMLCWSEEDYKEYDRKYNEIYDRGYDVEGVELKDLYNGEYGIGLEVYYEEQPIEEAICRLEVYYRENGRWSMDEFKSKSAYLAAINWMDYDIRMREARNYGRIPDMPLVLGNLALAVALIVLIIWLAGRRAASETLLYFRFAKYIFAVLSGLTVFCVGMFLDMEIWQKGVLVLAALGAFVLCVNWLTPREERWLGEGKAL